MNIVVDGDSILSQMTLEESIEFLEDIVNKSSSSVSVYFIRLTKLCEGLQKEFIGRNLRIERIWTTGSLCEELDAALLENHASSRDVDLLLTTNALLIASKIPTSKKFKKNKKASASKESEKSKASDKKKLAFLSPLPPQKSGIADYSQAILSELEVFYDIEVFTELENSFNYKSYRSFEDLADKFDRVVFQLGNNPMHSEIYDTMLKYPGVSVLHDFNLGDLLYFRQCHEGKQHEFNYSLIQQHGYKALTCNDLEEMMSSYPCSKEVFSSSLGVITHSESALKKANKIYSANTNVVSIPLVRDCPSLLHQNFKSFFSIDENVKVFASFGQIGSQKLHLQLLEAWESSGFLAKDDYLLLFIGALPSNEYGRIVYDKYQSFGEQSNIKITGYVSSEEYEKYLASTDIAIQLRANSRGETSAAILDCLNYAIPTIVNENDSFNYFDTNSVYRIDKKPSSEEIAEALIILASDKKLCSKLSKAGRKLVKKYHSPKYCAEKYKEAIEQFYSSKKPTLNSLVNKIKSFKSYGSFDKAELSKALALNELSLVNDRTLYVDITSVHSTDLRTGIQRVVRAISRELLLDKSTELKVKLVYLSDKAGYWEYYEAVTYTQNFLDIDFELMPDLPVIFGANDILLHLDFNSEGLTEVFFNTPSLYPAMKKRGTKTYYVVYDLLPVRMPEYFPDGTFEQHQRWLEFVAQSDGVLCISNAVKDDFLSWTEEQNIKLEKSFIADSFPLGCDLSNSNPSRGLPSDGVETLREIEKNLTFLMVGTIEPRKGHIQVLKAFKALWGEGSDIRLVYVGKKGWLDDSEVSLLNDAVENHPEFIWLNGISDEYLERVYRSSTCLIAASEGEGYGLPLSEAASYNIPIIARDIPVFREVAQNCAYFFKNTKNADDIYSAVNDWLKLFEGEAHPSSQKIKLHTWRDCKDSLLSKLETFISKESFWGSYK